MRNALAVTDTEFLAWLFSTHTIPHMRKGSPNPWVPRIPAMRLLIITRLCNGFVSGVFLFRS